MNKRLSEELAVSETKTKETEYSHRVSVYENGSCVKTQLFRNERLAQTYVELSQSIDKMNHIFYRSYVITGVREDNTSNKKVCIKDLKQIMK